MLLGYRLVGLLHLIKKRQIEYAYDDNETWSYFEHIIEDESDDYNYEDLYDGHKLIKRT